jgi:rhodanese-related sulfurtransferase
LVELLEKNKNDVLIVDVRDDDYTGKHIQGSMNFPSKKYNFC